MSFKSSLDDMYLIQIVIMHILRKATRKQSVFNIYVTCGGGG